MDLPLFGLLSERARGKPDEIVGVPGVEMPGVGGGGRNRNRCRCICSRRERKIDKTLVLVSRMGKLGKFDHVGKYVCWKGQVKGQQSSRWKGNMQKENRDDDLPVVVWRPTRRQGQ